MLKSYQFQYSALNLALETLRSSPAAGLSQGVYNRSTMRLLDSTRLRSASTARTYPVQLEKLIRTIEEVIGELPGWSLESSGTGLGASRKTRLGFTDEIIITLTPSPAGAHTNTHVVFHSFSRISVLDLGQNARNLKELLAAIDRKLIG